MFSSSSTTTSDYSNPMAAMGIMRPVAKWKYSGGAEIAPSCPRCASANTKFCYYNNYSLSQPRYFCKSCRRYWTKGGSLRNVPVGGGCRKTRRARAAASRHTSSSSSAPSYSPSAAAACIDMAAVFAKYVNQSDDDSLSPGSSSENAPASDGYHAPLGMGLDQVQQVLPGMSTCQDVTGQQFLYQDCSNNGFDQLQQQVQGVLSEDVLWGEEGTTALPNFAYTQPMVQVEDCGLFAPDHDHDHSNLVSDNWSAFDLSAYDFYSTP